MRGALHKTINVAYLAELEIVAHIVFAIHMQNGWTPLLYAAEHGHENVAEVLLKAGTKVDVPGKVYCLL